MTKNLSCKDIYRRGYEKVKSPIKHSLTAKSRPARASFLEVFILDKHRGRLRQEKANLTRRITEIDREIGLLDREIDAMRRKVEVDMGQLAGRVDGAPYEEPPVRTMPITY